MKVSFFASLRQVVGNKFVNCQRSKNLTNLSENPV